MDLVKFVLLTIVECLGLIIYIVNCEIRAARDKKIRAALERRIAAIEQMLDMPLPDVGEVEW